MFYDRHLREIIACKSESVCDKTYKYMIPLAASLGLEQPTHLCILSTAFAECILCLIVCETYTTCMCRGIGKSMKFIMLVLKYQQIHIFPPVKQSLNKIYPNNRY